MLTINPYASLAFAGRGKRTGRKRQGENLIIAFVIPSAPAKQTEAKLAELQTKIKELQNNRGKATKIGLKITRRKNGHGVHAVLYQGAPSVSAKKSSENFYQPKVGSKVDLADLSAKVSGKWELAPYEAKLENGAFIVL